MNRPWFAFKQKRAARRNGAAQAALEEYNRPRVPISEDELRADIIRRAGPDAVLPDGTMIEVKLAPDRRPDWLRCEVGSTIPYTCLTRLDGGKFYYPHDGEYCDMPDRTFKAEMIDGKFVWRRIE